MFSAIVFDVNETLLDLRALDPAFADLFGPRDVRREWFNEVLKLAFVTTIVQPYSDFGIIGNTALAVLEQRYGRSLTEAQRDELLSGMRKLPAHTDVPEGLEMLRKQGFHLVALTNSTPAFAEAQLTHAGIRHFFQSVFSADAVKRLKPAAEPYQMVASGIGVAPNSLLMVAAHSWDIAGAIHAGWNAAFIARPGKVLDALTPKPAFIAPNLLELARKIVPRQTVTQDKR